MGAAGSNSSSVPGSVTHNAVDNFEIQAVGVDVSSHHRWPHMSVTAYNVVAVALFGRKGLGLGFSQADELGRRVSSALNDLASGRRTWCELRFGDGDRR